MSRKLLATLALLAAGLLAYSLKPGHASDVSESGESVARRAVGTWLLTVTPASPAPPFQEFLTLHADGTLSESNTGLHPNSAIVPDFPFNGSEGFGTWHPRRYNRIEFKIVKFVFDADNIHIGYLVVDGIARVNGDRFRNLSTDVNILLGIDLDNPTGIVPLGSTEADGQRIELSPRD